MADPRVTVLMSVYNGEKYLIEAVDSILGQTFTDFEFLIINDGSTDGTLQILEEYDDPRIKIVSQKNMGLTKSLNKGLALAKGNYIARMDCDDISFPERLTKQVTLLDKEEDVVICGSQIRIIGSGKGNLCSYPTSSDLIKATLLFDTALPHSSVMMRNEALKINELSYDDSFCQSQDYDLWVRVAEKLSLKNSESFLVLRRMHPQQIGEKQRESQNSFADRVRKRQLLLIGIDPTEPELKLHNRLSLFNFDQCHNFIEEAEKWFLKLLEANSRMNYFSQQALRQVIRDRWFALCFESSKLGISVWDKFWQSPLAQGVNLKISKKLSFWLKCLINY